MRRRALILAAASILALGASSRADDGYRLWLRYDRLAEGSNADSYSTATSTVVLDLPGGLDSPILVSARRELSDGLSGLLGRKPEIRFETLGASDSRLGEEGYAISRRGETTVVITANRPAGALYGAFALLREIQTRVPPGHLASSSVPRIERRVLDHWDNLNRTVERGYAGFSLWEWYVLPEYRAPRYRDYARACASVGINGAVLNNVNADPLILTEPYLIKVAAIAEELRPWGMRVYLSARFTAPIDLGELKTADPLDPKVAQWWKAKADEVYRIIPDFGGFLVKANSEGQPGPQDSGRTHADGANVIADALAPHGGIVMWRAFVYGAHPKVDRVRQAYLEFKPLDGKFRPNVVLQIKNGPLDFQPREPFHPLFGAMPHTRLALELQITQEYLGASIQLAYLGPLFEEVLRSDTFANGPGSTVASIIERPAGAPGVSVIAGVANTGTDRDWTGHPLAASNWYAFGRLAWDDRLDSGAIAEEWARMTFGSDPGLLEPIVGMLQESREDVVNYSMPLGLHHIMATDYHYGPGPWAATSRPDWTPSYYHRADAVGLGADRTASGTDALADYAPEIAKIWGDPETCPENLLLWFHHVPWDKTLRSGRTLWDELCLRYQAGVDGVRRMERSWAALSDRVDAARHEHVAALLGQQERDAEAWRDACILYFQQFSKKPAPAGVEPPLHSLAYYESIQLHHFPGTPSDK